MGDSLHIHHLSLLCGSGGTAGARQAVERLLGGVDLRPSCLPPAAVLIVRRMHDPMPGHMAGSWNAGRADGEWERRVRGQLTELTRTAARPVRGPVPADAHAVLFLDESELLASLAIDVRSGSAQERWWWSSFFRKAGRSAGGFSREEAGAVLTRRMIHRPQAAVAAIARLAERGLGGEALQALTPLQAGQVLSAIAEAYHLFAIGLFQSPPYGAPASIAAIQPPWHVASVPSGFGRKRAALLGLSVDLHARPAAVRTHEYQHRALVWWQATASGEGSSSKIEDRLRDAAATFASPHRLVEEPLSERLTEALPSDRQMELPPKLQAAAVKDAGRDGAERTGSREVAWGEVDSTHDAGSESRPLSDDSLQLAPSCRTLSPDSRGPKIGAGLPSASTPEPVGEPPREQVHIQDAQNLAPSPALPFSAPQEPRGEAPQRKMCVQEARCLFPPSSWLPDAFQEQQGSPVEQVLAAGLPTELGGVLYLINMMAVLDLPGCFEEGWGLASEVGAWGTLDALARELLDHEFSQLREDPVWSVLAELDGRPPELPPGFRLPRSRPHRRPTFEIPSGWLEGLPDLELVPFSSARLQRIYSTYPPLLAGWIGCVLPFITARLCLALGVTSELSLSHVLLRFPARLYLTPSNLDMVASLESISLAVRKAGLDADPGWVPEFGRFVRFHFE